MRNERGNKARRYAEDKNIFAQEIQEGIEELRSKNGIGIQEGWRDERAQNVLATIYETDPFQKALTGRTPERIEQETGIPRETMFPYDAKILYVGDPWQKMGLSIDTSNMTIIDYEYGESASFVTDNDQFRYAFQFRTEAGRAWFSQVSEEVDPENRAWLGEFSTQFEQAADASERANDLNEYPAVADLWKILRESLEQKYKEEIEEVEESDRDPGQPTNTESALDTFRREMWYTCVEGERGFRDVYDFEKTILPALEAESSRLDEEGIREEDKKQTLAKKQVELVDTLRLKKKPKNANVVKGIFPALPFQSDSFDRLVASWSISAHAFAGFDREAFGVCLEEIHRVLRDGGEAYIFPLHYTFYDLDAMVDALDELKNSREIEWKAYDIEGNETGNMMDAETLWIKREH